MMIDYSQGDERWADVPYPKLPYCLKYNGCGPTTVANLVTLLMKKVTPKETGTYMRQHGYAVAGQGTLWAGMPLTIRHYGLMDKEFAKIADSWSYFEKYGTGYILFGKGTKGGITWTANGHYMAIEGYKKKGDKHYFLMADSGNRGHDGWYCYEDTMKGLVKQIHVVYKKDDGKLRKGDKGPKVKELQKLLNKLGENLTVDGIFGEKTEKALINQKKKWNIGKKGIAGKKTIERLKEKEKIYNSVPYKAARWAIKTAKDNSFAYGKGGPKNWYHGRCRARQVGCYYCGTTVSGPKKAKKGSKWEKTYCCNSFVMASYVHGGNLFKKCKGGSTKIEYWTKLKKDGKTLFELSKNPTVKTLKVGDILCNGKHVKLYVGDGKVAHAKRQGWDAGSITVETIKKIGDYKVARYKGPTTI